MKDSLDVKKIKSALFIKEYAGFPPETALLPPPYALKNLVQVIKPRKVIPEFSLVTVKKNYRNLEQFQKYASPADVHHLRTPC